MSLNSRLVQANGHNVLPETIPFVKNEINTDTTTRILIGRNKDRWRQGFTSLSLVRCACFRKIECSTIVFLPCQASASDWWNKGHAKCYHVHKILPAVVAGFYVHLYIACMYQMGTLIHFKQSVSIRR